MHLYIHHIHPNKFDQRLAHFIDVYRTFFNNDSTLCMIDSICNHSHSHIQYHNQILIIHNLLSTCTYISSKHAESTNCTDYNNIKQSILIYTTTHTDSTLTTQLIQDNGRMLDDMNDAQKEQIYHLITFW